MGRSTNPIDRSSGLEHCRRRRRFRDYEFVPAPPICSAPRAAGRLNPRAEKTAGRSEREQRNGFSRNLRSAQRISLKSRGSSADASPMQRDKYSR